MRWSEARRRQVKICLIYAFFPSKANLKSFPREV